MTNWYDHLTEKMDRPRTPRVPKGDGWFTFEEFQAKSGMGIYKARKAIKEGVTSGKIKVFIGTNYNVADILCRQIWYKEEE